MPDATPQTASGRDLARQALAAYKATTKNAPAAKQKPTRRRTDRTGGRDPVPFGAALSNLNGEQGWGIALQGGSILDRWATLCPQYVGLVQPVAFHAESGRLDLRPVSHAYATQLRMLGGQLAKQINDKLGKPIVRSIRVLPVGPVTTPDATPEDPGADITLAGPARTRETASPGYQRTLRLAVDHKPHPAPDSPAVAAARARLNDTIASSAYREPETAFTDAVVETERAAEPDRAAAADTIYQAALRVARSQKAGATSSEPSRLFDAG